MTTKVTWSGGLTEWLDGAVERTADQTPLEGRLANMFRDEYIRHFSNDPVGDNNGPLYRSVTPPVVKARKTSTRITSRIKYAAPYARWRREHGHGELLPFSDRIAEAYANIILDWTFEGIN